MLAKQFKILCAFFIATSISNICYAGAQKEEHLSFAIKQALIKAISGDNEVKLEYLLNSPEKKTQYLIWKNKVINKLQIKLKQDLLLNDLADGIYYESHRAGLNPEMVLGLIQVESGFKKYALSPVGARGLMQVMPFWSRSIGNGDASSLFNMQVNLRYGCSILRHYIDRENGNLFLALGRYNGSRGQDKYPNLVFSAWNQWQTLIKN